MKIAITGTTSGIGYTLAKNLRQRHTVFEINRPRFDLGLLSNLDQIDLTGVDVLINNAGHSNGGGVGLLNHKTEDWASIINVNLQAPIYLTQKFIQQNTQGKIIFLTSKAIENNIGGDAVYSCAKSGLSTFISCMRDELSTTSFKMAEIRSGRVKTSFARNRNIHTPAVLETFYDNKPSLDTNDIVSVTNFIIDNDFVQSITISK
jgi:NADP-dependent 3-hydroxy acid dehydrogenase YdfG